jgi:hypothetical protein
MADNVKTNPIADDKAPYEDRTTAEADEPLPTANDPGGAHAKGYSADPAPGGSVARDPVPLAPAPDDPSPIKQPERAGKVKATGRREPGE